MACLYLGSEQHTQEDPYRNNPFDLKGCPLDEQRRTTKEPNALEESLSTPICEGEDEGQPSAPDHQEG